MSYAEPSHCAICGGVLTEELLRILEPDRFELHVGIAREGYLRRWVECGRCGAATDVHSPENAEKLAKVAADYYEIDFKESSIGAKFRRVMQLPRSESDNALRVERVLDFIERRAGGLGWHDDESRRALDIGAGTGVFLARFLETASVTSPPWSATAVEPDPIAAEHLRKLDSFEVVEEIYSNSLRLGLFQLCTLNKVIEHVTDPIALLASVRSSLAPGGVVYVEVPDKMTAAFRPSTDNGVGALHHHLYTMEALSILCQGAGFLPLEIDRHFEPSGKISLSAFAVADATASRLAERSRGA